MYTAITPGTARKIQLGKKTPPNKTPQKVLIVRGRTIFSGFSGVTDCWTCLSRSINLSTFDFTASELRYLERFNTRAPKACWRAQIDRDWTEHEHGLPEVAFIIYIYSFVTRESTWISKYRIRLFFIRTIKNCMAISFAQLPISCGHLVVVFCKFKSSRPVCDVCD